MTTIEPMTGEHAYAFRRTRTERDGRVDGDLLDMSQSGVSRSIARLEAVNVMHRRRSGKQRSSL
jgi:hypothetical protein